MKTILITGGAGFIGSNFIKMMLREHPDYMIVNLDALGCRCLTPNATCLTSIE